MDMNQPATTTAAATNLKNALRTSAVISRIADKPLPPPDPEPQHVGVATMAEPASSAAAAAGGFLLKLAPAAAGALLMAIVDPPATKRELFFRVLVAFLASYLLGDVIFEWLQHTSAFAFLDTTKRAHNVAVDGMVGALGWFVFGGLAMWLKRFRADPVQAVKDVKG